jgi:hypothetical protein
MKHPYIEITVPQNNIGNTFSIMLMSKFYDLKHDTNKLHFNNLSSVYKHFESIKF